MKPLHVVFATVDESFGTEWVDRVTTTFYRNPDQSALCGLLSPLRALGIEVVEVHLVPDTTTLASTERSAVEPREGGDEST